MDSFYSVFALITAGVALQSGFFNLLIGKTREKDRAELIFGTMGLILFVYFICPPIGYVTNTQAHYSSWIELKRLFIAIFHGLFPFFLESYTRSKIKGMAILIAGLSGLSYFWMVFTRTESVKPFWVNIIVVALLISAGYGLYLSMRQIKKDQKKEGYWLLIAMIIYSLLILIGAINQFGDNYFGKILGATMFFPFHLYPLSFFVIMSLRLQADLLEKYRLEKRLRWQDTRWHSVVQNMQLLVLELDRNGKIVFINPYAVKAMGYESDTTLIGKDWFDLFFSNEIREEIRNQFDQAVKTERIPIQFTTPLLKKNGDELVANWTNVWMMDEKLNIKGTMSIGLNMTEREKALNDLRALKLELEKEKLSEWKETEFEEIEPGIIGKSEAVQYAIQKAIQVAETNATVLLVGETGVGKELFAGLIHHSSYRKNKPLVKINCAALPAELIESELFGHEKGSFTGAFQARKGRFELADGGTIFLDEIGELPLALQPKLLRVLQNGEFERIGGQETLKVDVRIISATNRDLLSEVGAGRFREDLFYRLNVFPITIPSLRKRREDIPSLVNYYVELFKTKHRKKMTEISKADLIRLTEYSWPGNIRELINLLERSVISSNGSTLQLDWLNPGHQAGSGAPVNPSMVDVEKAHILKVLKDCKWKINGEDGAAFKLGLNPNTLRSRMKKLNIHREA